MFIKLFFRLILGEMQEKWTCANEKEDNLESSLCVHLPRPKDSMRPCYANDKCSPSDIPTSPFGRWLISIATDLQK